MGRYSSPPLLRGVSAVRAPITDRKTVSVVVEAVPPVSSSRHIANRRYTAVAEAAIRQESTIDDDELNEESELADLVLDARYSLENRDEFTRVLREHGDRPRIGYAMVAFMTSNAELYRGLKFLEAKIAVTPIRDDERLVL